MTGNRSNRTFIGARGLTKHEGVALLALLQFADGLFQAAIRHPTDGALQPARWVRRLAARAVSAGAEIVEESRVESLDEIDALCLADVVCVSMRGANHMQANRPRRNASLSLSGTSSMSTAMSRSLGSGSSSGRCVPAARGP